MNLLLSATYLLGLLVVFGNQVVEASHFRYGQVAWTRPDANKPRTVRFTVDLAWRSTGLGQVALFLDHGQTNFWLSLEPISCPGTVSASGCSSNPGSTAVQSGNTIVANSIQTDPSTDSTTLQFVFEVDFNRISTSRTDFLAKFEACCRIGNLKVGSNAYYSAETLLKLDAGFQNTGSARSNTFPIVDVPLGNNGVWEYNLAPVESDPGAAVTCSVTPTSTSRIPSAQHYDVTADCKLKTPTDASVPSTLAFTNANFNTGDLWPVSITMTSSTGEFVVLDFLIRAFIPKSKAPTCTVDTNHPQFINGAFQIYEGRTLNVNINVKDDANGLTVSYQALPSGGSVAPVSFTGSSGTVVYTFSPIVGQIGSYPVGLRIADAEAQTTSCNIPVVVIADPCINDSTPPKVNCPASISAPVDANCQVNLEPSPVSYTVQEACQEPTSETEGLQGVDPGPSQMILPYTISVTDDSGNTGVCTTFINKVDGIAPTISCPASDVTINVDQGSCDTAVPDFVADGTVSASDNCVVNQIQQVVPPGSLVGPGTYSITMTATDVGQNTASCSFNLIVEDTQAPQFTCPSAVTLDADIMVCGTSVPDLVSGLAATDNCGSVTFAQQAAAGDSIGLGSTTITVTATDSNQQTTSCGVEVTVVDNKVPVVTCPAAFTVNVDGNCQFQAPEIDATKSDVCGIASVTQQPAPGTYLGLGDNTIVVTVADSNGNVNTCSVVVTGVDVDAPVLTCPAKTTFVDADNNCVGAVPDVVSQTTITDNCDASPVVVQTPATGDDALTLGTHTIVVTATDASGNVAKPCDATVTVQDVTPPNFLCPADLTLDADEDACGTSVPTVYTDIIASDNCGVVTFEQELVSGSSIGLGDTTITVTGTDTNGLTTSCDMTVTVVDNTVPVVTCPAAFTVNVDGNCQFQAPEIEATTSDACGIASVTQQPAPGTYLGLGNTEFEVTVTDNNGNVNTCSVVVTGVDVDAPVLTCPAKTTFVDADNNCVGAVPDVVSQTTITDNCDASPVVVQTPATGDDALTLGTHTIVVTATDASGNVAKPCDATVTVQDVTPPVIYDYKMSHAQLWPPNHTWRTVKVSPVVADNCAKPSDITCTTETVISNEISQWEDQPGGKGPNDKNPKKCGLGGEIMQIIDFETVQLCSERNGTGTGRVYSIGGTCTDLANNDASFDVNVIVPHDMSEDDDRRRRLGTSTLRLRGQ